MTKFTLSALGWNEWFASQAGLCGTANIMARVAAVDRDQLLLVGEHGFFRAKLSGKYLHESEGSMQRPCVGDWVCVEKFARDLFGKCMACLSGKQSFVAKPLMIPSHTR